MRLVRQRDELKQVTKLAEARAKGNWKLQDAWHSDTHGDTHGDTHAVQALRCTLGPFRECKLMQDVFQERDSYYILGLSGPSASEEEALKCCSELIHTVHGSA